MRQHPVPRFLETARQRAPSSATATLLSPCNFLYAQSGLTECYCYFGSPSREWGVSNMPVFSSTGSVNKTAQSILRCDGSMTTHLRLNTKQPLIQCSRCNVQRYRRVLIHFNGLVAPPLLFRRTTSGDTVPDHVAAFLSTSKKRGG
jgi:hypothetical protein